MACFQSSSSKCSEGRARVYKSCLQTIQRIVSIVLYVSGVGAQQTETERRNCLLSPALYQPGNE